MNFKGNRIAVLGGSGLLGSSIVSELSKCDAQPIIVDVDFERGEALKSIIVNEGRDAEFFCADFSKVDEIADTIKAIVEKFGNISGWVLSFYPRTDDWGNKLESVKPGSWNSNVEMQMNATCLCAAEIAKNMAELNGGSIVTIGSIYGSVAPNFDIYKGTDMTTPAAYAAIKGGVSAFTKYLSSYYGSKDVRVNNVVAGGIFNNQDQSFLDNYSSLTSLNRLAEPEEVANAVMFLLSDSSSYITGIDLPVDGGYLSR